MKSATKKKARDNGDTSGDDSLFGESSSTSSVSSPQPDKKRRRLNKNDKENDNDNDEKKNTEHDTESTTKSNGTTSIRSAVDPVLLEHAKSRLSKFAARLFDPNRTKVRFVADHLFSSLAYCVCNAIQYNAMRTGRICIVLYSRQ